jgi:serine/threonine protein kinase
LTVASHPGWSLATTKSERAVTEGRRKVCLIDESSDLQYLAPEVLDDHDGEGDGSYGAAQDVWALGVLYHILLAGGPPVDAQDKDDEALRDACLAYAVDRTAPWATAVSAEGLAFLEALLAAEPNARPTAAQCLGHPYMRVAISRATVLNADLAQFAGRRKKKLKRAKTKLKFVVRLIIQANRARKHRQEQNAAAAEAAAVPAAAVAPEPAAPPPSVSTPVTACDVADVEETVVLTDC